MDGLPARARSVRGEGGLRDLDHQLRSAPLRQLAGPALRPVAWLGAALPACLPACLEPAICCVARLPATGYGTGRTPHGPQVLCKRAERGK
jgi:hypothetical protein